jgi:hypothetical protein
MQVIRVDVLLVERTNPLVLQVCSAAPKANDGNPAMKDRMGPRIVVPKLRQRHIGPMLVLQAT